jgi:hypothetical protein
MISLVKLLVSEKYELIRICSAFHTLCIGTLEFGFVRLNSDLCAFAYHASHRLFFGFANLLDS